mmetsp:Transcript_22216/g.66496  ORF Transcript_22216/g.66496 Transcript_22216/m.66496 type:complete len:581 (-) Transcript_22216:86-1828(-)
MTDLHQCVADGRLKHLKSLHEARVDLESLDVDGDSPVHCAIRHEQWHIVDWLLDQGISAGRPSSEGQYLIHYASGSGHLGILCKLLEHQVDIEVQNGDEETAVQVAACEGHWYAVDMLLRHGASGERLCCGNSLIVEAIEQGQSCGLIKLLLGARADPNAPCTSYEMPVLCAAMEGRWDIVETLLPHIDPTAADSLGQSLLHCASEDGNWTLVNRLLALQADPNKLDPEGNLSTHLAAQAGHWDIVTLLLVRKASGIAQNQRGGALIHEAAKHGRPDIISMLLAMASDPNLRTSTGETPLLLCATGGSNFIDLDSSYRQKVNPLQNHGNADALRLLLDHQADPDVCCSKGAFLVQHLALEGRTDLMVKLLDKRAQTDPTRTGGLVSALMLATNERHWVMISHLLRNRAELDFSYDSKFRGELILAAASDNRVDMLPILFERGISVREEHWDGEPLHAAARNGHGTMIQALLSHRADINATCLEFCKPWGAKYLRPIHCAAYNCHWGVVVKLLKAGCRFDEGHVLTKFDCRWFLELTLLHGRLDVLQILLQRGDRTRIVDERATLSGLCVLLARGTVRRMI